MNHPYYLLCLLLMILTGTASGQNDPTKAFVHTAGPGNITAHYTIMNHPDLDGNTDLNLIYTHIWDPNGGYNGVYADKKMGLWYSSGTWRIYNQDLSSFVENSSFNVLIPGTDIHSFRHTNTNLNITADFTVLDHPALNNNPGAVLVVSDKYGKYNHNQFGIYYNPGMQRWRLFNMGGEMMTEGLQFNVAVAQNGNPYGTKVHISDSSNTFGNWTEISNPNLDGNPNATVLVTQYWAPGGPKNNNNVGVYYTGDKWAVYNEDHNIPMPHNAGFHIIYFPNYPSTGITSNDLIQNHMNIFPNPASADAPITLTLDQELTGPVHIRVFNLAGQCVYQETLAKQQGLLQHAFRITDAAKGIYTVHIENQDRVGVQKLVVQ
jgi:hypothetical protein